MGEFFIAFNHNLSFDEILNLFLLLSENGFKYNVYKQGDCHFGICNYEISDSYEESELNTIEKKEKLYALAKLFSISDAFTIDFFYQTKSKNIIELKLIYNVNSIDEKNVGLSFVLDSFYHKSIIDEDITSLMKVLVSSCEILNPIYATYIISSSQLTFFPDLNFLPTYFSDLFFISYEILDRLGEKIVEEVKKIVNEYKIIKNKGIFFILSKERIYSKDFLIFEIDQDNSISSFIYDSLKK